MSARRPLPLRLAAYDKVVMWAFSNRKSKATEIQWFPDASSMDGNYQTFASEYRQLELKTASFVCFPATCN